jgi:predicted acyltransferase
MWGVLAGQLLKSGRPAAQKIRILAIAGVVGVAAGYALNPLTPIIKRICTSSFVIVSGGWCLLALALCYWLIDVRKWRRGVAFFAVVGMNPLLIYLITETGGANWLTAIARPFTVGLFGWTGEWGAGAGTSLAVWGMLWGICYFLYQRRIFVRI